MVFRQFLSGAILLAVVTPVEAQVFFGSEVGVNFAPKFAMTGFSNDRASVCDEYINPLYASVPGCRALNRGEGDDWTNQFTRARGKMAGVSLGWRPSTVRIEAEYFYRSSAYNETSDVPGAAGASGEKLSNELVIATDRIGDVTSHNVFANVYYDFVNAGPLTPYLGAGAGYGFTDVDYGYLWLRNSDPAAIVTGEGLPNAGEIRRNLASTASSAQSILSDRVFGWQIVAGADYAFTETVSVGVKLRRVRFNTFRSDEIIPEALRSHPPNLRLDGSEPVRGGIESGDVDFNAIGVEVKYAF